MVSNARLDFPEPDRPVTTTRLSRGISTEIFLRLWTRAPWTATEVRAPGFGASVAAFFRGGELAFLGCTRLPALLEVIGWFSHVKEGQLLQLQVALLREPHRRGCLAEESLIRQVFARRGH